MVESSLKRPVVLLNRQAGTAVRCETEDPGEKIRTLFESTGQNVEVVSVASSEIDRTLSGLDRSQVSRLIAAGGDGTVSACAKVAVKLGIPLGVLPLGTFNHAARDLEMPLDLESAVKELADPRIQSIDVGSVNGHIFLSVCVLGFYPEKIYTDKDRGQAWWQKVSRYFFTGLKILPLYRPKTLRFETDDRSIVSQTGFVAISNNPYLDQVGVMPAKGAFDTGDLGLYISTHRSRKDLMEAGKAFLFGSLLEDPDLITEKSRRVLVYSRKKFLKTLVDGELFNLRTPLEFESKHCSLDVLLPRHMS